jgi:hypothetical protein
MAAMVDPRHELELYRGADDYLVLADVDAAPEDIDVQWAATSTSPSNTVTAVGSGSRTAP